MSEADAEEHLAAQLAVLSIEPASVDAVRVKAIDSTDDVFAVATGVDGTETAEIELWEVIDGIPQHFGSIPAHISNVSDVAFIAGGTQLLSAGEGGELLRWALADRQLVGLGDEIQIHKSAFELAISSDGDRLITYGRDRQAHLWSIESGFSNGPLETWSLDGEIDDVVFAEGEDDEFAFAATNADLLFSLRQNGGVVQIGSGPDATAVTTLGEVVALGTSGGLVGFTSLGQLTDLDGPSARGIILALDTISTDGVELVAAGGRDELRGYSSVWANQPGSPVIQLGVGSPVTAIDFMPDGRRLLIGDDGGGILVVTLMATAGEFPVD